MITIDWTQVIEVASGIGIIGAALCLIAKLIMRTVELMKKPQDDLKEKVEKHDELLANDNERLKTIEKSLAEIVDMQRMVARSHVAILEHLETDNATQKMSKARKEFTDYLIDK